MKGTKKYFKYVIFCCLTIICVINTIQVLLRFLFPDYPAVKVSERNLTDIDFPLSFRICLTEIRDIEARFQRVIMMKEGY